MIWVGLAFAVGGIVLWVFVGKIKGDIFFAAVGGLVCTAASLVLIGIASENSGQRIGFAQATRLAS